jgi:hypothetical protein
MLCDPKRFLLCVERTMRDHTDGFDLIPSYKIDSGDSNPSE